MRAPRDDADIADEDTMSPHAPTLSGSVLDVKLFSYANAPVLPHILKDVTFSSNRGSRVLVAGANGACKSTVMSILGGKRMISSWACQSPGEGLLQ